MWTVTTSDGRSYHYDSFESAYLASRTLFGWNGYKITNDDESVEIVSKVRDAERKL